MLQILWVAMPLGLISNNDWGKKNYYLTNLIKSRIICVFCSPVSRLIFRYSTANSCKWSNIERYSTTYCFEGVIKEHARDVACPVRIPALFQKIHATMKAGSWHQVSTLILSTQEIAAAARALQLPPPFEWRQPQLDCVRPRLQKYFFKIYLT